MNSRDITLWLEERWYDALSKHLKDETVEEHLENVLDEMCNQLPRKEYERISQEIWQERQAEKEEQEARRTWSAYHVTERGEEWYFKVSPPARNCWTLHGSCVSISKAIPKSKNSFASFLMERQFHRKNIRT